MVRPLLLSTRAQVLHHLLVSEELTEEGVDCESYACKRVRGVVVGEMQSVQGSEHVL
jgi:hypothetical protein